MFAIVSSKRLRDLENAKAALGETLLALETLRRAEEDVAKQVEDQKMDAGKVFYNACGNELYNRQDAPRLVAMLAALKQQVFAIIPAWLKGGFWDLPRVLGREGAIDAVRKEATAAKNLWEELYWAMFPGMH